MKTIVSFVFYTLIWVCLALVVCYNLTGQLTKHDLFICWMFGVLCTNRDR